MFLACDEGLQIHEGIDRAIRKTFALDNTAFTDGIDDFVIAGHGLVLGIFFLLFLPEPRRFRAVRRSLIVALVLAAVSICLDALTNRDDVFSAWGGWVISFILG